MSVGSQLQQARRERQLSLAGVTKETKIQPWVLEALEADRLQELMSPVYVKGFLTTYAKFLHLNPDTLIAALQWPQAQTEQAQQPELPPPAAAPASPARPAMRLQLPLPLLRQLGLAAAGGALIAAAIVVNPLRWMPKLSMPHMNVPKLARASGERRHEHPSRSTSSAKVPKARRQVNVAPVVQVAKEIPAPQPATVKAASVTHVGEPLAPPAPPVLTLLPTQPLDLSLNVTRSTWVQLRADGKLLTQQRLERGATEHWTAKKRLELIVANPSQIELILNGQPISPFAIAHRGRLLITHTGISPLPEAE